MLREHDDGPSVSLIPPSIAAEVKDEQFVALASSKEEDFDVHVAKSNHLPFNCYPVSAVSMSGVTAGSYLIQRGGGHDWDSAVPSSSSSSNPVAEKAVAAPLPPAALENGTFAEAPRAEAGTLITESYKEVHPGLCWSAEVSICDGRNSRSAHDVPNTVTVYTTENKEEEEQAREPNAVLVLILLSAPIPLLSICTSIYTFFALFLVVITFPLRLCPPTSFFRSTTFSTQLCKLLTPALRRHERLARYRTSHHHRHDHRIPSSSSSKNNSSSSTSQFSASGLILVLTLAPFISLGLLLGVWIAAFFWVFAMILGNPDGMEKKDDGQAAVLGVNRWWQMWLSKGRRRI